METLTIGQVAREAGIGVGGVVDPVAGRCHATPLPLQSAHRRCSLLRQDFGNYSGLCASDPPRLPRDGFAREQPRQAGWLAPQKRWLASRLLTRGSLLNSATRTSNATRDLGTSDRISTSFKFQYKEIAMNGFFTLMLAVNYAFADEPAPVKQAPLPTKATFSIQGLHCPPCSTTVSSSLTRIKGIRTATVDFKTKSARIEFDENLISVQKVIQSIATTPHMMGAKMRYSASLSLSVPELKDADGAKKVKEGLAKVPGVLHVTPYPDRRLVMVQFGKEGDLNSQQLINALDALGFKAKTY